MKKPLAASELNLEGMMTPHSELFGLMLPVRFKLFGKYKTNCHSNFDILVSTEAYRKAVGKALPNNYYEEFGIKVE
jgi:hypothetical protein